jgi:hypothetical protein
MKTSAKSAKSPIPKEQTRKAKAPRAEREPTAKTDARPEADSEPTDRLPGSLEELKATKGGPVSFLFLSGQDKDAIANELKTAFNLTDAQAVKIVRRITGRARFFHRALQLMATK